MYPISSLVTKVTYTLFLGVLLLNVAQKRAGDRGIRKRTATLYWGIAFLIAYLGAGAVLHAPRLFRLSLPDWLILPYLAAVGWFLFRYREKTFPFRRKCQACGSALSLQRTVMLDSNLCENCGEKAENP